jgi:PAS domain S-box-containing protein
MTSSIPTSNGTLEKSPADAADAIAASPVRVPNSTLATDLHVEATYRLNEALVESENRMRRRIDILTEVVFETAADGTLVFVNPAWRHLTGLEPAASLGRALIDFFEPADQSLAAAVFSSAARPPEPAEKPQLRIRHQTGRHAWVELSATPINQGGFVGLLQDITRQHALDEEQREVSERRRAYAEMQREFISLVSHELRTPITAIQGAHFLINRQLNKLPADSTAGLGRLLRLQEDSLKTLRNLVDQVLQLNRIEHGAAKPAQLPPGDVRSVINKVVAMFNESMPEARVDFQPAVPSDFVVHLDESMMRAAVENLVSNGLKYSSADRKVQVHLAAGSAEWSITVIDEGRGMPEAEQARLFQPFFRASNTGTVPGTGLGLTIVRRIVDIHAGRIDFRSREGVGTTVGLVFPLIKEQPAP